MKRPAFYRPPRLGVVEVGADLLERLLDEAVFQPKDSVVAIDEIARMYALVEMSRQEMESYEQAFARCDPGDAEPDRTAEAEEEGNGASLPQPLPAVPAGDWA